MFLTKLRCRLNDSTIDALCVLRHHFLARERAAKEANEAKQAEVAKKAKLVQVVSLE